MGQVRVTLNRRVYRLQCGDGEEHRLEQLVAIVSEKLDGVVEEFGQAGQERLLMMAALLIADELLDVRNAQDKRDGPSTGEQGP